MKQIIYFLVNIIGCFAITYLMVSFVVYNPHPSTWDPTTRILALFITGVAIFGAICLHMDKRNAD